MVVDTVLLLDDVLDEELVVVELEVAVSSSKAIAEHAQYPTSSVAQETVPVIEEAN